MSQRFARINKLASRKVKREEWKVKSKNSVVPGSYLSLIEKAIHETHELHKEGGAQIIKARDGRAELFRTSSGEAAVFYSYRSATIGSTFVARRAGM